jgi:hypothetical protein
VPARDAFAANWHIEAMAYQLTRVLDGDQALSGKGAICAETGLSFEETANKRAKLSPAAGAYCFLVAMATSRHR